MTALRWLLLAAFCAWFHSSEAVSCNTTTKKEYKADILIMIDNFVHCTWSRHMRFFSESFYKKVLSKVPLGAKKVRIAISFYSDKITSELSLSEGIAATKIRDWLKTVPERGACDCLSAAFDYAVKFFQTKVRKEKDCSKVLIVAGDHMEVMGCRPGTCKRTTNFKDLKKPIVDMGIPVISVALGEAGQVNHTICRELASETKYVADASLHKLKDDTLLSLLEQHTACVYCDEIGKDCKIIGNPESSEGSNSLTCKSKGNHVLDTKSSKKCATDAKIADDFTCATYTLAKTSESSEWKEKKGPSDCPCSCKVAPDVLCYKLTKEGSVNPNNEAGTRTVAELCKDEGLLKKCEPWFKETGKSPVACSKHRTTKKGGGENGNPVTGKGGNEHGNPVTDEHGNPVTGKGGNEHGNPVTDEHGNPVTDKGGNEHGNPVTDEHGNPVTDEYGNPVTEKGGNEHGNPVTDEHGNPVTDEYGNPVTDDYGNNAANQDGEQGNVEEDEFPWIIIIAVLIAVVVLLAIAVAVVLMTWPKKGPPMNKSRAMSPKKVREKHQGIGASLHSNAHSKVHSMPHSKVHSHVHSKVHSKVH